MFCGLGRGLVVPGQTQKKAKQQGEQSVKINIKACWPCPAFVAWIPPPPTRWEGKGGWGERRGLQNETCSVSSLPNFLWNLLFCLINKSHGLVTIYVEHIFQAILVILAWKKTRMNSCPTPAIWKRLAKFLKWQNNSSLEYLTPDVECICDFWSVIQYRNTEDFIFWLSKASHSYNIF